MARETLFNASLHGPVWLTGGQFGTEAGLPNLVLLAIMWIIVACWQREVKYPNGAMIPDPRRRGFRAQSLDGAVAGKHGRPAGDAH
jgi:hypothetical protein